MFRAFISHHRAKLIYTLCMLIGISLILARDNTMVRTVESSVSFISDLFTYAYESIIIEADQSLKNYDALQEENERLHEQLSALTNELLQARGILEEDALLNREQRPQRLANDVIQAFAEDVVSAFVIGRGWDLNDQLIKVDRGLWDGVVRDQPVVAFRRDTSDPRRTLVMVGKVWRAQSTHSWIAPLSSPMVTLRGRVLGSAASARKTCTVTGEGENLHLARVHDLEPGPMGVLEIGAPVFTDFSLMDSMIPPGVFMGEIIEDMTPANENPDAARQYRLRLGVDLTTIETVYIVRPREQRPEAETEVPDEAAPGVDSQDANNAPAPEN